MNPRISIDPKVCHGQPVVAGTRVPVAIVIGSLAGGMTFDDVAKEYSISAEDIRACLAWAAQLADREKLYPMAG